VLRVVFGVTARLTFGLKLRIFLPKVEDFAAGAVSTLSPLGSTVLRERASSAVAREILFTERLVISNPEEPGFGGEVVTARDLEEEVIPFLDSPEAEERWALV
jgi:hypothetical protein